MLPTSKTGGGLWALKKMHSDAGMLLLCGGCDVLTCMVFLFIHIICLPCSHRDLLLENGLLCLSMYSDVHV